MNSQTLSPLYYIGVDIGGTKIEIVLIDSQGRLVEVYREPTGAEGPSSTIHRIAKVVQQLQQKHAELTIASVGVAIAGQVIPHSGIVVFAPNLAWHDVPFQNELHNLLQLPVSVINDVRAATYAEWLFGHGAGVQDFICLFVGTGIGAGIVSGGRMLTGHTNSAAEVGHMIINLKGRRCHCGNQGCFEAQAGGRAIGEIARAAVAADPEKGKALLALTPEGNEMTTFEVVKAAKAGDPLALSIIEEAVAALIAGIVSLANAFNPERIILGGGVIDGYPELIEKISHGVHQAALQVATRNLLLMPPKLEAHTVAIGAAIQRG